MRQGYGTRSDRERRVAAAPVGCKACRMLKQAMLGAVIVALLAGCAAVPSAPPASSAAPGAPGEPQALGLVNLWRVSGAEGESAETWLRLDAGEFQLWRECGMISGSWKATDTLMLASGFGASGSCVTGSTLPTVGWIESIADYRAVDGGWELTDARGTAVATLTIDGAPAPRSDSAEFYTQPPAITAETRAALAAPAPLPSALAPAADIAGRWVPASFRGATDPHVVFEADGTWEGSDGCNGGAGRWVVDGPFLLATSGVSTLIGCDGVAVPYWVSGARLVGADGDQLVLLDAAGVELGRLVRG
jgi:hypothetical protein